MPIIHEQARTGQTIADQVVANHYRIGLGDLSDADLEQQAAQTAALPAGGIRPQMIDAIRQEITRRSGVRR